MLYLIQKEGKERKGKKMFKKMYKVETIITPKNAPQYTVVSRKKMSKKEAVKLANTKKFGVRDYNKDYKWIVYKVTEI